jgi:GxxExxY protein
MGVEFEQAGIRLLRQFGLPVFYKGKQIPLGFIVGLKAFPALLPAHGAQLLTYLRMSGVPKGLLMNFHAPRLKDRLKRLVAFSLTASLAALLLPPC